MYNLTTHAPGPPPKYYISKCNRADIKEENKREKKKEEGLLAMHYKQTLLQHILIFCLY